MTHDIFSALLPILLVLWGIGLCFRSIGLRGLDKLTGGLVVFCLMLSVLWDPLCTAGLRLMTWLGRVVTAVLILCLLAAVVRWIRTRI